MGEEGDVILASMVQSLFRVPIFFLILLDLCRYCYGQTSIVAVRAPKVIALSADSLQINYDHGVKTPIQVCKITLLGKKSAFASAGLAEVPGASFDASQLVAEAWSKKRTLKAREQAFAELVAPRLSVILQAMKEQIPQEFAKFRLVALETVFISVENGIPKLIRTNYLPGFDKEGRVFMNTQRTYCPGDCPRPDLAYVVYLGEYAAIEAKAKRGLSVSYPAFTAHELVQLEIEKARETVGPPISTLQITAEQRSWPEYGKCKN